MRVAGCVFRGAVAGGCAFSEGVKTQPQPATRSCVSSGVPACVCVPYIYNLKKIIYIILYRVTPCRGSHNPKNTEKRNPGLRVASCVLGWKVFVQDDKNMKNPCNRAYKNKLSVRNKNATRNPQLSLGGVTSHIRHFTSPSNGRPWPDRCAG